MVPHPSSSLLNLSIYERQRYIVVVSTIIIVILFVEAIECCNHFYFFDSDSNNIEYGPNLAN